MILSKLIYSILLIFWLSTVNADDNIIRILIDKPDIFDGEYLKEYSISLTQNIRNANLDDYSIELSYCQPKDSEVANIINEYTNSPFPIDHEYAQYIDCLIKELKSSLYDMVIMNDRLLFSDNSYIHNKVIEDSYGINRIEDFLMDLSRYENSYDLKFNDIHVLEGGKYNNKNLIGLPYETDFDLNYFKTDEKFIKALNYCWEKEKNESGYGNINFQKRSLFLTNSQIDISKNFDNNVNNDGNNNISNMNNNENGNFNNNVISNNNNNSNTFNSENVNGNQINNIGDEFENIPKEIPIDSNNNNNNNNSDSKKKFKSEDIPEDLTNFDCQGFMKDLSSTTEDYAFTLGAFNNMDMLLDQFLEYACATYELPKKTTSYYEKFYEPRYKDKTYKYFKDYMNMAFYHNNLNKTLSLTIDEAYHKFMDEKGFFFKGKASYYHYLNEQISKNNSNSTRLNIKFLIAKFSVLSKKYLVINKNSQKNKDILARVAFQLTSKEAQLERSTKFGNIPTFDFEKVESDSVIQTYCKNYPDICNLRNIIRTINAKDMFDKDLYSASFLETRLVLPPSLEKFLRTGNTTIMTELFSNLLELKEQEYYGMSEIIRFHIVVYIVVILLIVVMILVFRKRKNPYIKAISPHLSNLTILGVVLNLIYPAFHTFIQDVMACHIYAVSKFFICNLIFLPLLAITFRIYYIYTNNSEINFGKKLNDKHLIIIIAFIIILAFTVVMTISFFDQFTLTTTGSKVDIRIFWCNTSRLGIFNIFSFIYYFIIVICMIIMIYKTISVSRRYGLSNCFYFVVLFFISCVLSETSYFLLENGFDYKYYIALYTYLISCISSVYVLVGTRLIYIMKHSNDKSQIFYPTNIVDLITFGKSTGYDLKKYSKKKNLYDDDLINNQNMLNYNKLNSSEHYSNFTPNYSNHSNVSNYNNVGNNYSLAPPSVQSNMNGSTVSTNVNIYNSPNTNSNTYYSPSNFSNNNYDKYEEDQITRDPNNYFFNLALENMSKNRN